MVYNNDQLDHIINPEGITRKSSAGFVYYYAKRDHIGSTRVLCYDNQGTMTSVQTTDYYPFGLTFYNSSTNYNRYLFSGKEIQDQTLNGEKLNLYDFGARNFDPTLGRWFNPDPALQFTNPYVYCANNPVNFIDPDGLAWRPLVNENSDGSKTYHGYEWVPTDQSYGPDGVLLDGLYEQAIFFSHNGSYNLKKDSNIGSSTATVYLSNGDTMSFDAMTNPSDPDLFATVPEGIYEAIVGDHKGYKALKMRNIGARYQTIRLGGVNPAYTDGRTYATGIDIHKAGKLNYTATINDGKNGVSEGCLLIDRNEWDSFIGIFNTPEQKYNNVSVTVSRTLPEPIVKTVLPVHLGRDVQIINTFIY